MESFLLQILNGLDKGSAYALIALGLTLIFGTLGVVNFAHGALFMIGAFCAVTLNRLLTLSYVTEDPSRTDFLGNPAKVETPYVVDWFGESVGLAMIDWVVPLAILFSIPIMVAVGLIMERGLIKHFYKRPHADQILVRDVLYHSGARTGHGIPVFRMCDDGLNKGPGPAHVWFDRMDGALFFRIKENAPFVFALGQHRS